VTSMSRKLFCWIIGTALCATAGLSQAQEILPGKIPAQPDSDEWHSLFDGKSLTGWKETPFTARGKVAVENESAILEKGFMTGITWVGDFPKADYEVRYQAMRIQGRDFFGTLTFPVYDTFCTLIVGGWGGMLVGLSSLDDMDASENGLSIMRQFNQGQWYSIRLRVADYSIQAWIDEEQVVGVYLAGRYVGLRRGEIALSKPLGFATYGTTGALRKIEYRVLPAPKENNP
jgi:hypothetical protein